ncbi:MAG: hypothetical protein KF742_01700 [Cryobacterium sp.]|nr:hypothetical protein [Cryobacterium sp.]
MLGAHQIGAHAALFAYHFTLSGVIIRTFEVTGGAFSGSDSSSSSNRLRTDGSEHADVDYSHAATRALALDLGAVLLMAAMSATGAWLASVATTWMEEGARKVRGTTILRNATFACALPLACLAIAFSARHHTWPPTAATGSGEDGGGGGGSGGGGNTSAPDGNATAGNGTGSVGGGGGLQPNQSGGGAGSGGISALEAFWVFTAVAFFFGLSSPAPAAAVFAGTAQQRATDSSSTRRVSRDAPAAHSSRRMAERERVEGVPGVSAGGTQAPDSIPTAGRRNGGPSASEDGARDTAGRGSSAAGRFKSPADDEEARAARVAFLTVCAGWVVGAALVVHPHTTDATAARISVAQASAACFFLVLGARVLQTVASDTTYFAVVAARYWQAAVHTQQQRAGHAAAEEEEGQRGAQVDPSRDKDREETQQPRKESSKQPAEKEEEEKKKDSDRDGESLDSRRQDAANEEKEEDEEELVIFEAPLLASSSSRQDQRSSSPDSHSALAQQARRAKADNNQGASQEEEEEQGQEIGAQGFHQQTQICVTPRQASATAQLRRLCVCAALACGAELCSRAAVALFSDARDMDSVLYSVALRAAFAAAAALGLYLFIRRSAPLGVAPQLHTMLHWCHTGACICAILISAAELVAVSGQAAWAVVILIAVLLCGVAWALCAASVCVIVMQTAAIARIARRAAGTDDAVATGTAGDSLATTLISWLRRRRNAIGAALRTNAAPSASREAFERTDAVVALVACQAVAAVLLGRAAGGFLHVASVRALGTYATPWLPFLFCLARKHAPFLSD